MTYVDKYGLYNVKPIKEDGEPTGNDGAIVSAYADKLGFVLDMDKIKSYYQDLPKNELGIPTRRLPYKSEPPVSRDTVLGWYWLNLLDVETLIKSNWNFAPHKIPRFNPFLTFLSFWLLGCSRVLKSLSEKFPKLPWKKMIMRWDMVLFFSHRNAIWENGGLPHTWRFAFSVPTQDRAYILKNSGKKVPLFYKIYEKISDMLPSDSDSSDLIMWRKYNTKLDPKVFENYFKEEHFFTKKVKSN